MLCGVFKFGLIFPATVGQKINPVTVRKDTHLSHHQPKGKSSLLCYILVTIMSHETTCRRDCHVALSRSLPLSDFHSKFLIFYEKFNSPVVS